MSLELQQIDDGSQASNARRWRREAMIAVAREMFFEHDYGGTSMSAVAAKVGGSKTTLWAYFPSKPQLFEAVIDELVERYGSAIEDVPLSPGDDLEETLLCFAQAVINAVLAPQILQLYRLVVSEAHRFPELGALYHRKGPGRAEDRLTAFFAAEMERGRLRRGDPNTAALYFLKLCEANSVQKCILNLSQVIPKQQMSADAEMAVETFLRALAPDDRRGGPT